MKGWTLEYVQSLPRDEYALIADEMNRLTTKKDDAS